MLAVGRRPLQLRTLAARALSAAPSPDAWAILGLTPGSDRVKVKARFYELAKTHHPDVVGSSSSTAEEEGGESSSSSSTTTTFVEILSAFEAIMEDAKNNGGKTRATTTTTTAPNNAARGGSSSSGGRKNRGSAAGMRVEREPSLGEVLCERLVEEPTMAKEVWADILYHGCQVRATMLEALFRACGSKGGGGLPAALDILRDAKEHGLLTNATREAAAISIIKWCKEDSTSFSRIVAELGEADRVDPQVRETLAYANALYYGLSEGYSA